MSGHNQAPSKNSNDSGICQVLLPVYLQVQSSLCTTHLATPELAQVSVLDICCHWRLPPTQGILLHCSYTRTTRPSTRHRGGCFNSLGKRGIISTSQRASHPPFMCLQGSRLRPFFESVRVKNLSWSHLCKCMVCAARKRARCQPQHIVAGERFHWSCEERRFQRERFSRAWLTPVSHRTRKQSKGRAEAAHMQSRSSVRPLCFHSPRQHEREGAHSGRSAAEDLIFKLK